MDRILFSILHSGDVRHIRETIKAVGTLHDDVCQDKLEFVLENASVSIVLTHFLQYLDELHNTRGHLLPSSGRDLVRSHQSITGRKLTSLYVQDQQDDTMVLCI